MHLLETKNKKFNLPIIFIIGVVFVVGLAYFAHYIENLTPNALNLIPPKTDATEKATSVSVRLATAEKVYLDSVPIEKSALFEKIKQRIEGQPNPTILLFTDEGVAIEEAVTIMEFANNNQYKIILGVQPK